MEYYFNGLFLGLSNFFLVVIFDIINIKMVKLVNVRLYIEAIYYNLVNLVIISPIVYFYIVKNFSDENNINITYQIINIVSILFFQGILYHLIHKLMHTPLFYKIHKFHHKFNKYVIPMSANAVSIYEFLLAYLIPIIFPIYLFRPDYMSINISILIISLNNILIHSPVFTKISKYLPNIFVSTEKHMIHHKTNNKYFSAPIINFDSILIFK